MPAKRLLILLLLSFFSVNFSEAQNYYGLKYAEPVLHIDALDPIYGRRHFDQIRIGELLYSRLWRWNHNLSIESDLLVAVPPIDTDSEGYRCTLKPDVFWSDGTPITTDDVVFTLELLRNCENKALKQMSLSSKCVKIDDKNFELGPNGPIANWEYFARYYFAEIQILPKHILLIPSLNNTDEYVTKPTGSGSFKLDNIEKYGAKTTIRFSRNRHSPDRPHRNEIKEVIAVTEPDFFNQYNELISTQSYVNGVGKIDLMLEEISDAAIIRLLKQNPELEHQRYARNSWTALALNTRKKFLNSPGFRIQLDNMLDDKEILRSSYQDDKAATDITGPFLRKYGIYDEDLIDRVGTHQEILDNLTTLGYDYNKEKGILSWIDHKSGKHEKVSLVFIYNKNFVDASSREMHAIQEIISNFKKFGIEIDLEGLNRTIFDDRIKSPDSWDIAFVRRIFSYNNNITPIFTWKNETGYKNPQLTADMKDFLAGNSIQKIKIGERIHKHCYDNVPYIFLWHVKPEMHYRNIYDDIRITPMKYFTSIGMWQVIPR
jgi:ABC-type transport system substrate-binding protein